MGSRRRLAVACLLALALLLSCCAQPAPAEPSTPAITPPAEARQPDSPLPDTSPIGSLRSVIRCREWVTLREQPSTSARALTTIPLDQSVTYIGPAGSGFAYVGYQGFSGYVLEQYLGLARTPYQLRWIAIEPQARQASNLFLSNFTELSLPGCFEPQTASDSALIGFAVEHICHNQPDAVEYGPWPEGDARVPGSLIDAVLAAYLDTALRGEADTAPYIARDGYAYWTGAGEPENGGFACVTSMASAGDGLYMALFDVYGAGAAWDSEAHRLTRAQARQAYGPAQCRGMALFTAADLADRSGYRLVQCVIQR